MKKILILTLIITSLGSCSVNSSSTKTEGTVKLPEIWEDLQSENICTKSVLKTSLVVNINGVPYIANLVDSQYNIVVKRYNGKEWVQVGQNISSDAQIVEMHFVLNTNNNIPYLFYAINPTSTVFKIKALKYNGTEWQNVADKAIDSFENELAFDVDKSGNIYMAHMHALAAQTIFVEIYKNGAWAGSQVDGTRAHSPFIKYNDLDNNLYVAVCDSTSWKASVKKFDKNGWQFVGNREFEQKLLRQIFPMLTTDKDNNLFLSFITQRDLKVYVYKYDGNEWSSIGGEIDSVANFPNWPIIAPVVLDKLGNIYLAYLSTSGLKVQKYDGTKWLLLDDIIDNSSNIKNISLKIDGNNNLYVSYKNQDQSKVKKIPLDLE